MFDLFRFIMLRPPQAPDQRQLTPLKDKTNFVNQLRQARDTRSPRDAMIRVATAFTKTEEFVSDQSPVGIQGKLEALEEAIRDPHGPKDLRSLKTAVEKTFGASADKISASPEYSVAQNRLSDSILAAKVMSPRGDALSRLTAGYTLLDLIARVARDEKALDIRDGILTALNRTIAVPSGIFPVPVPQPPVVAPAGEDRSGAEIETLRKRTEELKSALEALTAVPPQDFHIPAAVPRGKPAIARRLLFLRGRAAPASAGNVAPAAPAPVPMRSS